jgi:hypothetical protein
MTHIIIAVVVVLISIFIGLAAQIWTVVRKLPSLKKAR